MFAISALIAKLNFHGIKLTQEAYQELMSVSSKNFKTVVAKYQSMIEEKPQQAG
jgi:hypothetical protein